jgi:hypothetical protein
LHRLFKHSGDLGDIIFSLPTIRALGGGLLYLDPNGGEASPFVDWAGKTGTNLVLHLDEHRNEGTPVNQLPGRTRTNLTTESIESLRPLLLQQEYIVDVQLWYGETVDHDLDAFRRHNRFNNLSDAHLAAFELPFAERDRAWLTIDQPIAIDGRSIVAAFMSAIPKNINISNTRSAIG